METAGTPGQREARSEAAPIALLAAGSLVGIAVLSKIENWRLLGTSEDWWLWLVVATPLALLAAELAAGLGVGRAATSRRRVAIGLIAFSVTGALTGLAILVATLVARGAELRAPQLLVTGLALLVANVAAFGIALWELDCGGPVARTASAARTAPDLQFPQDENPALARAGWAPHAFDYLYVSLTNSIAFSPTDTMPLTRSAKALLALESVASAVTVLVVAARAVNVFGQ